RGKILVSKADAEQYRDYLDCHRLELVRLLAERRVLQVAEHVVRALRYPRELDEGAAADIETRLTRLQAREALAQRGCGHDRRAGDVTRRCRRERAGRDVARTGSGLYLGEIAGGTLTGIEHSG